MPITLDEPTTARTPVLRRRRLGETYRGLLVRTERRDMLKDGKPLLRTDGRPRQELVVTLVTADSTMSAGLGDTEDVPTSGDIVRAILKGGGYGSWIEADNALKPRQVGDLVTLTSTHAQVYDADGHPSGGQITDQPTIDKVPRGRTVGIYGDITIERCPPEMADLLTQAEATYMDTRKPIVTDAALDNAFGAPAEEF